MENKDFEILEKKIRSLVDEINKQRKLNNQLQIKMEELNKHHREKENTENMVKTKIENLIKIIDSIENE